MNKGNINCKCSQEFYYETIRDYIICIQCGKRYEFEVETFIEMEVAGE